MSDQLTKREQIAAQAMQALIPALWDEGGIKSLKKIGEKYGLDMAEDVISKVALNFADELLQRLDQKLQCPVCRSFFNFGDET